MAREENQLVFWNYISRTGLVVALALLVLSALVHVECTNTTEPAPVMLAVDAQPIPDLGAPTSCRFAQSALSPIYKIGAMSQDSLVV